MQSVGVQKRRKRSINFTESDRQLLMNLVQPYFRVIENKRLDKFSSKLKSETWENIKIEYNHLNSEPRTALQLKHFYETIKYRMRKMNTENGSDEGKIVQMEVNRKTILDALALIELENNKNEEHEKESTRPKIKCVNIEKLQNTIQSGTPIPRVENAQRITNKDFNHRDQTMKLLNMNCSGAKITPNSAVSTPPTSSLSLIDSANKRHNELHTMRMKILEDERLFRQREHLKHMEYFNTIIMAMKASLLKPSSII